MTHRGAGANHNPARRRAPVTTYDANRTPRDYFPSDDLMPSFNCRQPYFMNAAVRFSSAIRA